MNHPRTAALIAALSLATLAAPPAAFADPPAVAAPTVPVPFAGAPHNDDPNAGQFTANFDDRVRFEGAGRPAEHYDAFALGMGGLPRPQMRASESGQSVATKRAIDRLFAAFALRLRTVVAPDFAAR